MEDFVTWVDTSKLKRTIMQYNDEVRFNLLYFTAALPPSIAGRFRSVVEFIRETETMAKKSIHTGGNQAWMARCYLAHHIPNNKGHQALYHSNLHL